MPVRFLLGFFRGGTDCLVARGYTRSSQGNPDESRAARYILKDYINGRILHCIPPEGVDAVQFNEEIYQGKTLSAKREEKIKKQKDQVVEPRPFDTLFFRPATDESLMGNTVGKFASSGYQRTQLYPSQVAMNNDGSKSTVTGYSFTGSLISSRTTKAEDPLGKKHYNKTNKPGKNRQRWTEQP
jgi:large subunit GTPase 1